MLHIQLHSKKGEGWALPGMTLATTDSEMSMILSSGKSAEAGPGPATEAGPGKSNRARTVIQTSASSGKQEKFSMLTPDTALQTKGGNWWHAVQGYVCQRTESKMYFKNLCPAVQRRKFALPSFCTVMMQVKGIFRNSDRRSSRDKSVVQWLGTLT